MQKGAISAPFLFMPQGFQIEILYFMKPKVAKMDEGSFISWCPHS